MIPLNRISRKQMYFALSFIMPVCIMALVFALSGCYPFGQNHILYGDLSGQYLPFYVSFIRNIKEGSSLFWSWDAGLGFDYWVNIPYYLTSPLNLLLIPIPEHLLHYALPLFILLKYGLAGLFMSLYLERTTEKAGFLLPVMASCYAVCAFFVQNYWNVIWFDAFATFPLVMLGLHLFMRGGKYKLYFFSLFICILSNFLIGWYICVFVALFFFGECIVLNLSFKEFGVKLAKIAGISFLAVCLTAVVTLPALLHLLRMSRGGYSSEGFLINNFYEVIASFSPLRLSTYQVSNLPTGYCGVITLMGCGLFFGSGAVKKREKIVFGVIALFIFLSLNVIQLDLFWNLSTVLMSVYYRYSFLLVFLLVTMAYRAFTSNRAFNQKNAVYLSAFVVILSGCLLLEGETLLFAATVVFAVLYLYMFKGRAQDTNNKQLAVLIAVIAVTELIVSGQSIVNSYPLPYQAEFVNRLNTADTLLKKRGEPENLFSRTDFAKETVVDLDLTTALYYGANGVSNWTSMIEPKFTEFFDNLGLAAVPDLCVGYTETSPLIGMFTALEYYTAPDKHITIPSMWEQEAVLDDLILYKNKYFLPLGFMANTALSDYKPVSNNPVASQNAFFKAATGIDEELFTYVDILNEVPLGYEITQTGFGEYAFKASSAGEGSIIFEYAVPQDGLYYGYCMARCNVFVIPGDKTPFYPASSGDGNVFFAIGELKENERIIYSITPGASGTAFVYTALLNESVPDKGYEVLSGEPFILEIFEDTYVKGAVTAKENGLLYTSVPVGSNKHWRAYVNGAEQEIIPIGGLMAALELPQGTHTVEFKYYNTHFVTGFIISAAALLVFILLCLIKRTRLKANNALSMVTDNERD